MKKRINKKLVCLFPEFGIESYSKDPFLVPYYLGKILKMDSFIVCSSVSLLMPQEYRGVKLLPLSKEGKKGCWLYIKYLFKQAQKIDCLVCFHFSYQTILYSILYKTLNPRGTLYIKADGFGLWNSLFRRDALFPNQKKRNPKSVYTKIANIIIKSLLYLLISKVDKVSVETPDLFNYLKVQYPFKRMPQKLVFMLNGTDEELIQKENIIDIPVKDKEKIILTVGRHGSWQKNTILLLDALSSVNLREWSVVFVGTIEENFKQVINQFFLLNPDKKDKVHFVGPIYEQKKIWEYFNRSKIFVHTAIYESFGLVLMEAFRFNNYLISTPVGIAPFLIEKGYGEVIFNNDSFTLSNKIQNLIDKKDDFFEKQYISAGIQNRIFSFENEISKLNLNKDEFVYHNH